MTDSRQFLAGGGQVGELMRSRDWSASPLGPPEHWPQSLRIVVGLLLQSQFPMFVAWGDELGFLYNDPYAEILGAKHPAALGARFQDIWSEIWTDISPLIDAAMAGQATYREDLPLVMNRKGYDEQTWFTFSYSPVRDESGKVAGMFCAVSETTRRVLAERALREDVNARRAAEAALLDLNETLERRVSDALAERRLLAEIIERTDAFVQVVDLDYRWLAINHAAAAEFERIFGVRPRVGDNMLDLLAEQPDHQQAVRAVWSRALSGEEFTATDEFGSPSRVRRAYEMRFNTLRDRDGGRIGAYQFVYDVTDRLRDQERLQKAEAALRHAQKMESLGQLTGGVAHDFNNLLAVFATGLQLLERTGQVPPPRILQAMRRAVARGTGLTRHLLAFSRRRPLNPEAIDTASQLRSMRTMLDGSLGGNIDVEMNLASEVWPIEVDAGEMELAVLNLCLNGRDAMASGGRLVISAANAVLDDDGMSGDFVKIAVADSGHGMTPEVQARVFEPFFTTKDISKGSGLGLPQVYGFAQQSGGHVLVESTVGVGTVVTLLLPRSQRRPAQGAAGESSPHASPVEMAGRGHVLLVEDDQDVSALTRQMLSEVGFTVTHVASADAALDALAGSASVDVVFSDIMLAGGTNGIELAREIRRRRPLLPVVLTTGYAESAADVKDGEFQLLLKPFTVEVLVSALATGPTDAQMARVES